MLLITEKLWRYDNWNMKKIMKGTFCLMDYDFGTIKLIT